jgi:hypothetical protein
MCPCHCRTIVPTLIEKFADSKVMVRTASLKVLKQLHMLVGPQKVIEHVTNGMRHSNWVVREGVVNACIMVSEEHPQEWGTG